LENPKWKDWSSNQVRSIEIINKDGGLERIYFRVPDMCENLKKETKEQLLLSLNRDSPTSKVEDFLEKSESLSFQIEHQTTIQVRKKKYINYFCIMFYCICVNYY